MPFLSVITICRNDYKGLVKTIRSVESQSLDSLEHVVIYYRDKAEESPPPSQFPSTRAKIYVGVDGGISDAFNRGLANSSGRYILFLNSGDTFREELSADLCFRIIKKLEFPEILAMSVDAGDGRILLSSSLAESPHQGLLVAKSVYDRIGGYSPAFSLRMDLELCLRAHRKGIRFEKCREILSNYPQGGQSNRISNRFIFYWEAFIAYLIWSPENAAGALCKAAYWRIRLLFMSWLD